MIEIRSAGRGKTMVVTLGGRLDGLSAPDLTRELEALILAGHRRLLLDLAGVPYISSAGLRVLLVILKKIRPAGGELVLAGARPLVEETLKSSGLDKIFIRAASVEEWLARTEAAPAAAASGFNQSLPPGRIGIFGDWSKLDRCDYSEAGVVPVNPAQYPYALGLGALGDEWEEFSGLFGETAIIAGHTFVYPAVKKTAVDFLLSNEGHPAAAVNFLQGLGFTGRFASVQTFEKEEGGITLSGLLDGIPAGGSGSVTGVVLLAVSAGLFGMNLKRIPLAVNRPADGSIFDASHFADWMDYPLDPAFNRHVVAAAGIAVTGRRQRPAAASSILAAGGDFHLHAVVFGREPLQLESAQFDNELQRVLTGFEPLRVQHVLARSSFSRGYLATLELEL